jgi:hypothetical protein
LQVEFQLPPPKRRANCSHYGTPNCHNPYGTVEPGDCAGIYRKSLAKIYVGIERERRLKKGVIGAQNDASPTMPAIASTARRAPHQGAAIAATICSVLTMALA